MFARYGFVLVLAALFSGASLAAEESPDWNSTTLTGDWGGTRSSLYSKGVSLELTHKSDVISNVSGGIKRGSVWMGNTEAGARMNLEKLLGWESTSAYIHFHAQHGSRFNRDYVGSFVGVDNIETGFNTGQFNSMWVQKSFSDDRLSVLGGLYSIDSEFYVTDTSGVFLQPPYGMSNDLAQTGRSGPPIFPVGALAVRVKYHTPGKNFYLQGALTDAVPGDPNNPRGTHIKVGNGDGTLSIVELGYTPKQGDPVESAQLGGSVKPDTKEDEGDTFNKTAIGFWRYSTRFNDLVEVDALGKPLRRISQGMYFLAERTLYAEKNSPGQGLAGFVRFGTANRDIQQADWTGSLGLRYQGLFAGRDDDISGIAATFNHASNKYRLANNNADSSQTMLEATYRAQLKPWFALQPSLQYIQHPGMNRTLKNAWVIGARAEVNF